MSWDTQVPLSITCSHMANWTTPGHPHAYMLRGDGLFTKTPGHSGFDLGELEERAKTQELAVKQREVNAREILP